jgi:acid phosphatase (class A)
MRYGYFVLLMGLAAAPASAGLLDASRYDASKFLPPPPVAESAATQSELAELRAIAASADAGHRAAAARDARDETPDIFNGAIGFDVATAPQTRKLLQLVADEEEGDSKVAKEFFHRDRPYTIDSTLKTCTPVKPGKASNSYPSGHATLGFSMGLVLAQLLPSKAQAILARAYAYAENRLVCGVHYRSDIVAGQQFGTVLALRLMENAVFQAQMAAARVELGAAGN